MFLKSLLIGCIGLSSVVGTALATGDHHKDKNETKQHENTGHSGDSKNHNHTCTLVQIGEVKTNPKCGTPTPTGTPAPTRSPKVTPTPVVTPSPAPSVTPAASQTVKSSAPAVLPSVGGSGRLKP
jgi:hypothetical protein